MRPKEAAALIKSCTDRGWIQKGDVIYTPAQAAAMNIHQEKPKKKKRGPAKKHSDKQDPFCMLVRQSAGVHLVMEFRFDEKRQWRFDYANEEIKLAIEQEGGVWSGGRHTRGAGYVADMEKYNAAALLGWTVIRRTPQQMMTDETMVMIRNCHIASLAEGVENAHYVTNISENCDNA
ncbi:hypothetical protein [Hufsiella ginkgonis]|uniref:hypothetical protein n=1 Tax=Hufsiella ginkgonis TaxID=2695274 RepID=UPI0019287E2A|nr:hypothetical protein [Hufsiella ginkgonis]